MFGLYSVPLHNSVAPLEGLEGPSPDWSGGSASFEQAKKVKAIASPKAASLANNGQADPARTMSCLIVCSPFLRK